MKKCYLLLFITSFFLDQLKAQDNIPKDSSSFVISGSVDTYFRTNLNAKNTFNGVSQAPTSAFANLSGFSLGMINLITSYDGNKTGFVADLVFGPRGRDAVFASPYYHGDDGTAQIINQLYVYWKPSDKVTLSFGNFNTYLGYELISPTGNFNYSTSYMFSFGPFSHTGLKADFQLSDDLTAMVGVMNPIDLTEYNPVNTYTVGGQLGYKNMYLNLLYGDQDGTLDDDAVYAPGVASQGATFQVDLTAGWDLTDNLYFGLNGTYNTTGVGELVVDDEIEDADGDGSGFYGAAAYVQQSFSDVTALGLRVEYFKMYNYAFVQPDLSSPIPYDNEGDGDVLDITLTGNIYLGNLTIMPEVRMDIASEDYYIDNDYELNKSLASFVLAAVYSF